MSTKIRNKTSNELKRPPKLDNLLKLDDYLTDFQEEICRRYTIFTDYLSKIDHCGGLDKFSRGYEYFGLIVQPDNSVVGHEWAPNADKLSLIGDFNNWNRDSNVYDKLENGKWHVVISPKNDGSCAIPHGSIVKDGRFFEKLSPWAQYITRPSDSIIYHQEFYNPPSKYILKELSPKKPKSLRIYEAHVGISSWEGKIASYREFADNLIPRIKHQGYNAIQLMAVMEHVYYASFGYQVTSYFAPASRSGNPNDLKYLVDRAHKEGIYLLLDVVHSHSSKNVADGLNEWDGTNGAYFHDNSRGFHALWDSRLFNYSEMEVLRFLLSNLRFWIDEYGFDGFRFDGVTSMLYHSHGINDSFIDGYPGYFGLNVDTESVVYLMLANHMLHTFYPQVITIAEEVSGMPAVCRPINEGGLGFDYRLAMAIPDMWIRLLKHSSDEHWNMDKLVDIHENRRYGEKHVSYAESHDQALVGDKTIAFWLMDKEMYDFMSVQSPLTAIIDRGLALHKMIRLFTNSLGGEAWLNFMGIYICIYGDTSNCYANVHKSGTHGFLGNEFGHPEWLDFPRVGNGESFHYCRRQWHLADDDLLRYKFLNTWDRVLNQVEEKHHWLSSEPAYVSWKHNEDKVVAFERANLVFVFNFHSTRSFPDYKVGVQKDGRYTLALDSDSPEFGGHGRLDHKTIYHTFPEGFANRMNHLCVYIPTRTCLALELMTE